MRVAFRLTLFSDRRLYHPYGPLLVHSYVLLPTGVRQPRTGLAPSSLAHLCFLAFLYPFQQPFQISSSVLRDGFRGSCLFIDNVDRCWLGCDGEIPLPFTGLEKSLTWLIVFPQLCRLLGGGVFGSSALFSGIFPPMLLFAVLLDPGSVATNIITHDSFSCHNATPSILRYGHPFDRLAARIRINHLFGRPRDIRHMADCVGDRTGL